MRVSVLTPRSQRSVKRGMRTLHVNQVPPVQTRAKGNLARQRAVEYDDAIKSALLGVYVST